MDAGYIDNNLGREISRFLEISNEGPSEVPIDIPGIRIKHIQKRKMSAENDDGSQIAKELMEKLEQDKKLKKQKEAEKRKKMHERLKQEQIDFEKQQEEIKKQKERKLSIFILLSTLN
jgi:polyphosphate kinase 2 (PPK2 family)